MSIYLTTHMRLLCPTNLPDTLNLNRQDKNPLSLRVMRGP